MWSVEDWMIEYCDRVWKELQIGKKSPTGKIKCDVYVYDLLEKSNMTKSQFYKCLFELNQFMSPNMVLYLKGENE